MKRIMMFFILMVLFIQLSSFAVAEEDEDLEVFGLEVEKLLNLGSGILAATLFLLTLGAHSRTRNKRYLFVALAFLLFAVKGFLMGAEIFFGEWDWVDPVTAFLDFGILATFFAGIVKK